MEGALVPIREALSDGDGGGGFSVLANQRFFQDGRGHVTSGVGCGGAVARRTRLCGGEGNGSETGGLETSRRCKVHSTFIRAISDAAAAGKGQYNRYRVHKQVR